MKASVTNGRYLLQINGEKTGKDSYSIFIFAFHWFQANSCRLLIHFIDFHRLQQKFNFIISPCEFLRNNHLANVNAGSHETIALLRSETDPQQLEYENCKHGHHSNSYYRPENIYTQLCELHNHSYKTNTWQINFLNSARKFQGTHFFDFCFKCVHCFRRFYLIQQCVPSFPPKK